MILKTGLNGIANPLNTELATSDSSVLKRTSSIITFLLNLNSDLKGIEVGQDWIQLPLESSFGLPALPDGFGYKGGAARHILLKTLGLPLLSHNPRDLDLVSFGQVDSALKEQIEKKIMPVDYAHGYGAEHIQRLSDYFKSRDLTINEVCTNGNTIYFTSECLFDLVDMNLRITNYELDTDYINSRKLGKIFTKMLRMWSDAACLEFNMNIIDSDLACHVSSFHLALQLDRCMNTGREVTEHFLKKCFEYGLITADECDIHAIDRLISRLANDLYEGIDFFDNLSSNITRMLDDFDYEASWDDAYDRFVYREGMGRRYRKS